jgi:hypothetical protein
MRCSIALTTLAVTVTASEQSNNLAARQQNNAEQYIQEVCFPETTSPVPPCQAIINIESACLPNGTTPLAYSAHQQCMCNGGYFSNWSGCLNCQYVHGTRSEAVRDAFDNILSSASSQFCNAAATPTAVFASYFSALSNRSPQTATGVATSVSDRYPSQSAVSLYFTATGVQGPGLVTGSAAMATATAATSSKAASASANAVSSASRAVSSSASTKSTTSSAASAAKTGAAHAVAVNQGLIAVAAGAMMLM